MKTYMRVKKWKVVMNFSLFLVQDNCLRCGEGGRQDQAISFQTESCSLKRMSGQFKVTMTRIPKKRVSKKTVKKSLNLLEALGNFLWFS